MNALEAASLVMIPSGYEDGTLGSLKPTDGTGDFTFTRGSNISATRVNADGNIEKGYENLLLQSNSFTTTWLQTDLTATSGQSGYDGSNDAWLLSKSAANGRIRQYVTDTGIQTLSAYFKAGTNNWMRITYGGATTYFDLANGVLGSDNSIDATITSIGSGWYRCTFTANVTSAQYAQFYVADANGDTSGTTGSILIQDAMLNQGMVAYPYVETTTAPVAGGILEDMPRLDYSNGSCPSLLLEGSRTNLAPYSEYIEGLGLTDLTATPNATTSPEGVQNAYKMLTGTGGSEQISHQATGTSGNTKTQSVYIKADSGVQWIRLIQLRAGFSNSASTHFDIQNGVKGAKEENGTTSVVDDATKIEDAGNGWYRLTLVCTDSTYNVNFDTRVRTAIADGSGTRVSNGSYFIWGYQMESDATYPTSYIPTYGVSQTRLSDVTDRGSNLAYTGNYTLFMEFELTKDGLYLLNSNTSTAYTFFIENDDCYFQFGRTGGDSGSVSFVNMFDWRAALGTTIKMAFYKSGTNAKLFVNGTPYTPSGNTLSTGNEVLDWRYLNYTTTPNRQQQAYIKQLVEFETALSDDKCIELTTI